MSGELYISVDVETDGPCPGVNSMLSLGAFAFRIGDDGAPIPAAPVFSTNFGLLPDADCDPGTKAFWEKNMAAYRATRTNLDEPAIGMARFAGWLSSLGGKPVFVGYPASFDFAFVYWYFHNFYGSCPFGFAALDIKSYAMAVLGTKFRGTVKRSMPKHWFPDIAHTHVASADAEEQGRLFANIVVAAAALRAS